MKAFILDRYGKKQALRYGDMPDPVPGPDDVVVEVEAAGLNQLDSKIRDGAFKPILPYKPPLVLGHDLAGSVIKTGANVRRFKVGDAVYARPRDGQIGAFAERIAVKESDLAPKPASLSMAEAAFRSPPHSSNIASSIGSPKPTCSQPAKRSGSPR